MTTLSDEATKPDVNLIVRRDEPAIEELAARIDRRVGMRPPMKPLVIARPAQLEKASAPMLAMMVERNVPAAVAEAERRRLAGESAE